jgi:hypothetical protein
MTFENRIDRLLIRYANTNLSDSKSNSGSFFHHKYYFNEMVSRKSIYYLQNMFLKTSDDKKIKKTVQVCDYLINVAKIHQ